MGRQVDSNADQQDRKKKQEYERKVAAIKAEVRKRKPAMRTVVPPMPPKPGTIEFERMVHPFKPNSHMPNIIGNNLDKSEADKKAKLRKESEKKAAVEERKALLKARRRVLKGGSDSDGSDEDNYIKRHKEENARFEDMVIPNIIDAETGQMLDLTKAMWNTEEGRVNDGTNTMLRRGTGDLKIKNRPDSSHRIVPIISPRRKEKSKLQKAGTKVLLGLRFKTKKIGEDKEGGEDDENDEDEDLETKTRTKDGYEDQDLYAMTVASLRSHSSATVIHNKKYHMYDETRKITDGSAQYWRKQQERYSVHHYKHLVDGLTEEERATKSHHNTLHGLHLNFGAGGIKTGDGVLPDGIKLHHHNGDNDSEKVMKHMTAKRQAHPLVTRFIKEGPQQAMYHRHWDKVYDKVVLPPGYINDEDGDAFDYESHDEEETSDQKEFRKAKEGVHKDLTTTTVEEEPGSARSTTSSVGFESAETISKDKNHPDKGKAKNFKGGALSRELEKAKEQGDALLEEGKNLDKVGGDDDNMSVLSDALDPENEVSWKALEDRYYYEIRDHALDYEANKLWTHEKPIKGGVGGMDIAARAYANWKMRSVKFIVQAIDDEERKETQRLAVEEELEINKPERLLQQVKVHNAERHAHRTYIKTFKYDMEILSVNKLYELGLVW